MSPALIIALHRILSMKWNIRLEIHMIFARRGVINQPVRIIYGILLLRKMKLRPQFLLIKQILVLLAQNNYFARAA